MQRSQNVTALQNFLATQHLLTLMMYNLSRLRKQNSSFYVSLFSLSVFDVGVNSRLSQRNIFLTFLYLVYVDLSGERSKKKKLYITQ